VEARLDIWRPVFGGCGRGGGRIGHLEAVGEEAGFDIWRLWERRPGWTSGKFLAFNFLPKFSAKISCKKFLTSEMRILFLKKDSVFFYLNFFPVERL
jgi:hypothetical protein